jgi:hypothetical protein
VATAVSGVHSIMTEKLAQAGGRGGEVHGAHPPSFSIVIITNKVAVYRYAPGEWANTLTLFHLYQYRNVLCGMSLRPNWDPLPPTRECVPPPGTKGGGGQFGRLDKKPSTLSALWLILLVFHFPHSI